MCLISLPSVASDGRLLKIAIVDTGLDIHDPRFSSLICGYKDFTGEGITDTHGHGTHIAGLIKENGPVFGYCFVILKYFTLSHSVSDNMANYRAALREAIRLKVSIINFSGGGGDFDEPEFLLIKDNPQVKFFVAAGNKGVNIDYPKNYFYPASYRLNNITVVGNVFGKANYGSTVNVTINGNNIVSTVPYSVSSSGLGEMSGSSQSTAIYTGRYLKKRFNK